MARCLLTTSQWWHRFTISVCLYVCLTSVSSTLLLFAVLPLPWHWWPQVYTWDKGPGGSRTPLAMSFYISESMVALFRVDPHPHIQTTTYRVGTSRVALLSVKIRRVGFNKISSSVIPTLELERSFTSACFHHSNLEKPKRQNWLS